jgi:hypothetical protein
MIPDMEEAREGQISASLKEDNCLTWSRHFSPTACAPQRFTLASIREWIARLIYPEGFYFDRDSSREIDRLIVLVESLGGRA